ncbi:MAG: hypothetical protein UV57_C0021G0030 [Parcubacteria group bacterium GW2011_GWD2_43_10]|nr:MAG: hypothetical protein UV47_C0035G0004 [Parcubacteria group bacterium GW2011_GWA2_42_80]KKS83216.1 MAG: hypothetical protein UV57_C0021G0030 [Parcubacteria group bacterium GW2011_GWD2_43_10]KKS92901.1 MAG: hypothetical protein UV69_C0019G0028 [Parcubacteria group bacterium GW2011_GWE2_43_12]KKT13414.1 MAG: hypothetical protein UV92_C0015G0002 [Parcubacteria group bacterium GW2011_GWA1_43_27]KKT20939.1 MAG: hypothetical protein UW06_C0049G0004 [Parcubacteria group bacterium GW2011_GWE1_43_
MTDEGKRTEIMLDDTQNPQDEPMTEGDTEVATPEVETEPADDAV